MGCDLGGVARGLRAAPTVTTDADRSRLWIVVISFADGDVPKVVGPFKDRASAIAFTERFGPLPSSEHGVARAWATTLSWPDG
jgi:hypothetical protein